jgi:hypothetical protein
LDYKYHRLTTTPYPCGLNSASYLTTLVSLRWPEGLVHNLQIYEQGS